MIIPAMTGNARGKLGQTPVKPLDNTPGVEVEVVVAGRYNGWNHKTLGDCVEGQVIRVAGGPYLQYLIEHELVRYIVDDEVVEPQADAPAQDPEPAQSTKRRGRR